MRTMTANDAKRHFGQLLDDARRAPVSVSKNGRPVAVMISAEDYDDLQRIKHDHLRAAIAIGLTELDAGNGKEMSVDELLSLTRQIKSEGRTRMAKPDAD